MGFFSSSIFSRSSSSGIRGSHRGHGHYRRKRSGWFSSSFSSSSSLRSRGVFNSRRSYSSSSSWWS